MEPWMIGAGSIIASAGAAFGGVKVALNGTRARVTEIKVDLKEHIEKDERLQDETIDRLARIETKLDMLRNN